ncbi:MAG: single-stranded DNA-binding protein [Deltaproteobacteria bacterium]|nr:single-stranded DNA-binding protein [Deltaproteobacteria bacterium]
MANSLNKVMLIGRLGKDPEQRFTGGGTEVCQFTLATNEFDGRDEQGQTKERTEWHDIVAYGKLAEICNKYLAKGRQAFIEGKLQTRKWEDKQSGEPRRRTEIVAREVVLLGSRDERGSSGEDRGSQRNQGGGQARPPRQAAQSKGGGGRSGGEFDQDPGYTDDQPPPEDDVPF